jgi:gamma-glutamyl AIG2-like cyclotransferase
MSFTRYFAYGSNMAESVMAAHCSGHRYLGPADLPEHRLAFTRRSVRTLTGVADIVRADGQSVWGALYELDESDRSSRAGLEDVGGLHDRCLPDVARRELSPLLLLVGIPLAALGRSGWHRDILRSYV